MTEGATEAGAGMDGRSRGAAAWGSQSAGSTTTRVVTPCLPLAESNGESNI